MTKNCGKTKFLDHPISIVDCYKSQCYLRKNEIKTQEFDAHSLKGSTWALNYLNQISLLWSLPYSLFLMESHSIQSLNSFCTCISGIWWQFLSADQQRTLSYENSSLFYALWPTKVNIFVHGVDDSVRTSFSYSIDKKLFLAIVYNMKTALYSMPSGQLRLTYLYTALMILYLLALLTAFAKKCFWPLCITRKQLFILCPLVN